MLHVVKVLVLVSFCLVWFFLGFPSIEGFCLKLVLIATNGQRSRLSVMCLMFVYMYVMSTCMLI